MSSSRRQPLRSLLLIVPLLALCLLYLADPLVLRTLRHAAFDQFQRWQPRPAPADSPIRLVDIDEASLARLGQWPWPRTRLAELVQRLEAAGASVVVFDVLFAEPDRTSPAELARHPDLPPRLSAALAGLPDHDPLFARALRQQPSILGFAAVQERGDALPLRRFALLDTGASGAAWLPIFPGTVAALPPLQRAAAGNGAMTFLPDADGVVRRVPLLIRNEDEVLPSLAAEALRVHLGQAVYRMQANADSGIERIAIGPLQLPTTPHGELWVHYRHLPAALTVPAWQLLQDGAPADLHGRIVLVGSSAQGLQDLRFSPLGGIVPGVQVHAQALEQSLTGQPLWRPHWAAPVEALVIFFGGLALALVGWRLAALPGAAVAVVLLASLQLGAWLAFSRFGLLLDALTPALCLVPPYLGASLLRHRHSERRQRWIREAFSRYVSPNLVDHLVRHPAQLELGGRRQHCSFVFTDLTGFTGLLEQQPPEQVVALLNDYLDGIIRIAFEHQGTLDRIVGDAVAVLFSAPLPQPDHPARALACARAIQRFTAEHAARQQAAGVPFGRTRIGVHSGEVVVGNFGGSMLFDYRALGDPVNVAARLEALNRHLGTTLCVSAAIREACPRAPMRCIGDVQLAGKQKSIRLYEPLDAVDEAYEQAFALMAAEAPDAIEAFNRLAAARPDDGLVQFHCSRLRAGERGAHFAMQRK